MPRLLLAVYRHTNSYSHLPAHLRAAGFDLDLVAPRGHLMLQSRALGSSWPTGSSQPEFAAAVADRLANGGYDALQFIDEPALCATLDNLDAAALGGLTPISDPELRAAIGHKDAFHRWCVGKGLPVPDSHLCDTWAQVERAAATFGDAPWFLKTSTGAGGKGVRRVASRDDLAKAREQLGESGPWLVQEELPEPVGAVQFVAHRGRMLGWFAVWKRVALIGGRGPTVVGEFCLPEGLEETCARACEAGGLNGLSGFDFMVGRDGVSKLIDPHVGRCTTMNHFGPACGVNFGSIWVAALSGRTLEVQRPRRSSAGASFVKFPEIIEYALQASPFTSMRELSRYWLRAQVGFGARSDWKLTTRVAGQVIGSRTRILGGSLASRLKGRRK